MSVSNSMHALTNQWLHQVMSGQPVNPEMHETVNRFLDQDAAYPAAVEDTAASDADDEWSDGEDLQVGEVSETQEAESSDDELENPQDPENVRDIA